MKRLLLITGDIAAVKTTFSNQLAQRYSVAVFQKDTIKEILGDNIGFRDREENRKLSNAAVQLMAHLFWQIAQTGSDLILEANFHGSELEQLHGSEKIVGEALWIDACDFSYQQDEQLLRTIDLFMK